MRLAGADKNILSVPRMIASTIETTGRGFLLPESYSGAKRLSSNDREEGAWIGYGYYFNGRKNNMNELLNPQQRSSLHTTLLSFEKKLREAQSWLDGNEKEGILYKAKLKISEEHRRQGAREITQALDQIRSLSRSFELEKKEEDPLSLIRSEMVISWANLLDSRSAKLGRYGDIAAGLVEKLDPALRNLAETALYLSEIFEDHSINRSNENVQD